LRIESFWINCYVREHIENLFIALRRTVKPNNSFKTNTGYFNPICQFKGKIIPFRLSHTRLNQDCTPRQNLNVHRSQGSVGFAGKSQEAPQLAVGRNGKRGFGGGSPHYGFFLGISPGYIARISSRNKMKSFRFEVSGLAPGRFTAF